MSAILVCPPGLGATVTNSLPGTSDMWLAGMPPGSTACETDSAPGQSPVQATGLPLSVGDNTDSFIVATTESPNPSSFFITSFAENGQLTWTNSPGTNGFSIEWAPTVTGPWSSSWQTLDALISTTTQKTVRVPMFYRVKQGFSHASARGVWIFTSPSSPEEGMFYVAQEDGILSESAMFIRQSPQGFFTVDAASGRVTNAFVLGDSGTFALSGRFSGADQIDLDTIPGKLTNAVAIRLDDASRCSGVWTGNLYPTNWTSGNDTGVHAVSFNVDARGLVTGFAGFAGNPIGRLFALSNGVAVGFIYTGEGGNGNPLENYNQVRMSGILSNNVIQGVYHVDEGSRSPRGTFTLTRQ